MSTRELPSPESPWVVRGREMHWLGGNERVCVHASDWFRDARMVSLGCLGSTVVMALVFTLTTFAAGWIVTLAVAIALFGGCLAVGDE